MAQRGRRREQGLILSLLVQGKDAREGQKGKEKRARTKYSFSSLSLVMQWRRDNNCSCAQTALMRGACVRDCACAVCGWGETGLQACMSLSFFIYLPLLSLLFSSLIVRYNECLLLACVRALRACGCGSSSVHVPPSSSISLSFTSFLFSHLYYTTNVSVACARVWVWVFKCVCPSPLHLSLSFTSFF